MIHVSPSIAAYEGNDLFKVVQLIKPAVHSWHIDVGDGVLAADQGVELQDIERLSEETDLPLDVHLMVSDPVSYLRELEGVRIGSVFMHRMDPVLHGEFVSGVKALRGIPGLALGPYSAGFSQSDFEAGFGEIMLMGVRPGRSGQPFIPEVLDKVAHEVAHWNHLGVGVTVDGGVTLPLASKLREFGADKVVMGSALMRAKDPLAVAKSASS